MLKYVDTTLTHFSSMRSENHERLCLCVCAAPPGPRSNQLFHLFVINNGVKPGNGVPSPSNCCHAREQSAARTPARKFPDMRSHLDPGIHLPHLLRGGIKGSLWLYETSVLKIIPTFHFQRARLCAVPGIPIFVPFHVFAWALALRLQAPTPSRGWKRDKARPRDQTFVVTI